MNILNINKSFQNHNFRKILKLQAEKVTIIEESKKIHSLIRNSSSMVTSFFVFCFFLLDFLTGLNIHRF